MAQTQASQKDGVDMRERLLEEATHLFAQRGFDGAPLSAIAGAVGITKPSLLYHFPTKAALRQAVLDRLLARWGEVLPNLLQAATTGGRRFRALIDEIVAFFVEDPDRARLLLREMLDRPDHMHAMLREHVAPWVTILADLHPHGPAGGPGVGGPGPGGLPAQRGPPDRGRASPSPGSSRACTTSPAMGPHRRRRPATSRSWCAWRAPACSCPATPPPPPRHTKEPRRRERTTMSENFYLDNEDLRFYVERGVDWEPLVRLTERDFEPEDSYADVDEALTFYGDMLEMFGKFVAREVDPRTHELDTEHPYLGEDGQVVVSEALDEIFEQMKQLGLHTLALPRDLGGMNAPLMLYMINAELLARADASTMTHFGFHGGIALALLVYSIHEGTTEFDPDTGEILSTRFDEAIAEIMRGEAWGSMDITEPDAGSDMAALRTKAVQDDDGQWYVTGQKIFITSGHGKYHVVIARTEADTGDGPMSGLRGLSTFLVEAIDERVQVARLEEKMGHHASPTCEVTFERAPAHLIGERGQGFKHMLLLMNNARIGVGFESLGLCEAAWRCRASTPPSAGRWASPSTATR